MLCNWAVWTRLFCVSQEFYIICLWCALRRPFSSPHLIVYSLICMSPRSLACQNYCVLICVFLMHQLVNQFSCWRPDSILAWKSHCSHLARHPPLAAAAALPRLAAASKCLNVLWVLFGRLCHRRWPASRFLRDKAAPFLAQDSLGKFSQKSAAPGPVALAKECTLGVMAKSHTHKLCHLLSL